MEGVAGMGPDAPTVEHENGSRESLCPYAFDVIFTTVKQYAALAGKHSTSVALLCDVVSLDGSPERQRRYLGMAMDPLLVEIGTRLEVDLPHRNLGRALLEVARVLADGEAKYGSSQNWRGIPILQHCRHALAHLWADSLGDQSEGSFGHLTRAVCRIAFAIEITMTPGGGVS